MVRLLFYIFAPLGRLAQLVQSTSFTPRGSGVRIPQRPHQSQSKCKALGFFVFKKEECFISDFFKTKNVHNVQRVVFAGAVETGRSIPQRPHQSQSKCKALGFFVFKGLYLGESLMELNPTPTLLSLNIYNIFATV